MPGEIPPATKEGESVPVDVSATSISGKRGPSERTPDPEDGEETKRTKLEDASSTPGTIVVA